jgi:hypothetical protein
MLLLAFDGQIDYTSPGLHFSTAVQVTTTHQVYTVCGDKVSENGDFLSSLLSQQRESPLRTWSRPCLEDRQISPARLFYYKLSTDWHIVGQSSF